MPEYIEREAAIEVCSAQYKECLRKSDWCGDTVAWNIGFNIKAIPAADVAPVVHGRWLYDSGRDKYFCSNCDVEPSGDCYGGCVSQLSNYCHNCGARMDGDG